MVVLTAYTIVQPSAVMIKTIDTAIAHATVLGRLINVSLTHVTLILVIAAIKLFPTDAIESTHHVTRSRI